jgi:hypothetical protein
MYLKLLIVVAFLAGAAFPAQAQEQYVRPLRAGEESRIQSSLSLTLPVKDEADAAAQQQVALRSFYKVAAGSCAMVVETVAETCEITSMTTNVNARDRNAGGYGGSQITLTGQITMKVKFKAGLSKTAP